MLRQHKPRNDLFVVESCGVITTKSTYFGVQLQQPMSVRMSGSNNRGTLPAVKPAAKPAAKPPTTFLLSQLFTPHRRKMKFTLAIVGMASTATAFSFTGAPVAHRTASSSALSMKYKVAVVGGGPSGACAAEIFAQEKGIDTVLFERKMDNAKPCGGAIPLCMVGEFDLPETVVDRKVCFFLFLDLSLSYMISVVF